jgi:hypothetical protein
VEGTARLVANDDLGGSACRVLLDRLLNVHNYGENAANRRVNRGGKGQWS